MQVIKTSFHSY